MGEKVADTIRNRKPEPDGRQIICYLHLGSEKTGTTTIQHFLASNRDRLLSRNILYPRSLGNLTHYNISAAASSSDFVDETMLLGGLRSIDERNEYRERLIRALFDEIHRSGPTTVIISNELLSSRLRSVGEIEYVFDFLRLYFSKIYLVFYVRNQIDLFASGFATHVIGGGTSNKVQDLFYINDYKLHQYHIVKRWCSVFSNDSLICRQFSPNALINCNIIDDFCSTVRIPTEEMAVVERKNESLDRDCLAFLFQLNKFFGRIEGNKVNVKHQSIVASLQEISSGRVYQIPRSLAQRIIDIYSSENSSLFRELLGMDVPTDWYSSKYISESDNIDELEIDTEKIFRLMSFIFRRKL